MGILFEDYFGHEESDAQPTIECHTVETPEGWVLNIHQSPGAPPPSPEVIAKLNSIAERIAAGSTEGKIVTPQSRF